jgi:hypothetical protein
MLYEEKQIKELNDIKHFKDNLKYQNYDYESNILNNSLSPFIYENDNNKSFLDLIKKQATLLFDNVHIVRNFKNYIVDKYYYKHYN